MESALGGTLLLIVVPMLVGLGAFALFRRRGTRSGVAGCGAILLAVVVSFSFIAFLTLSALL
ncbi:MAG: hypothetical protein DCC58_15020 [Chloroflexi bacterium]|nr:MAG: hypothetical protein DCC58_15020 [Chloroflexota bacterium]